MMMGRHGRTRARDQRGFTLIEMMIVVVILGVLAAIVVPGWFRESSKAKHQTEVTGMFSELSVKLEQYKIENATYLAAAACPGALTSAGYDFVASCITSGSPWETLRVAAPSKKMYCAYEIVVGPATAGPTPPAGFTMAAPATAWWYLVAECDMDYSGGTNATFFQSSVDPKVQSQNSGK